MISSSSITLSRAEQTARPAVRLPLRTRSDTSGRTVRVLRLVNQVGECNSAYNQYALPTCDRHETTICSFFRSTVDVDGRINLLEGDGSTRTFLRLARQAIREPFDVVHAHSLQTACLLLLAAGTRFNSIRKRAVCTLGTEYHNLSLRNRLLCLPVFSSFGRIVCCGVTGMQSLPRRLKVIAGRRLNCIPNGVDLDRVDRAVTSVSRQVSADTFEVCCANKLYAIKQPLLLLQAFEQAADEKSRLTVIGDGPLREDLATAATKSEWRANIELAGLVPRDQVYERMLHADLFVSTSRGEGLPVAVLEAMACGCPVVLSDIPPHRDIAGGNPRIPLVAPDDVAGFAREIERFRSMPDSRRVEIGRECREVVEARFRLDTLHDRYEAIYRELCGLGQ